MGFVYTRPGWGGSRGTPGFGEAGGVIGLLAAGPLSDVISPAGAAIVCGGLSALGLLIFTGTPFSVVTAKLREFREARDERDPVAADAREAERGRPRWSWRDAFGLTEGDVVVVPEADEKAATTETIDTADADEGGFPTEPVQAPKPGRSRTITTPQGPYELPPLDLLRTAPPSNADARAERDTLAALERTLETFGVDARVAAAHRGPTVTMYEVAVASGTKVQKVLGLSSDIAYALATPDVRIQAPIPG
jgi:S-DNA-T family DNA segregation ATPase FtsK/SpoIIIE